MAIQDYFITRKYQVLEPGKDTTVGNVADQLNKIMCYQVTLLVDEEEFGK